MLSRRADSDRHLRTDSSPLIATARCLVAQTEVSGLDELVVDAAIGKSLEICLHVVELSVQHLPFLLVELHLRIEEGVLEGDSSTQEFVALF